MRAIGLAGIRRGQKTIATVSNPKAQCPLDKVNRAFKVTHQNTLWIADFTYVHIWAGLAMSRSLLMSFPGASLA
jgi:putative transposase